MSRWSHELEVAVHASRNAAELAWGYQVGIAVEQKADRSPVTLADRECEQLIARSLKDAFPEDGLLGEEGATADARNGRKWIVDPIDGTRDYVRGNPLWANLIALEAAGDIVVGVVNLPALGLLYTGVQGQGAYRNGSAIQTSSKTQIEESVLCMNGYDKLGGFPSRDKLLDWMGRFWAVRGLGGAADAMMVASGQAEIWIEPSAKPWDFAPLKLILEEAGARFINLNGGSSIYAGNGTACALGLEPELRKFLSGF